MVDVDRHTTAAGILIDVSGCGAITAAWLELLEAGLSTGIKRGGGRSLRS